MIVRSFKMRHCSHIFVIACYLIYLHRLGTIMILVYFYNIRRLAHIPLFRDTKEGVKENRHIL